MLIFGQNREYIYNSEIWVNIGDIVVVSGKMEGEGRVVGVKRGT